MVMMDAEIDALPAGRELDRLIARIVFGKQPAPDDSGRWIGGEGMGTAKVLLSPPPYSTEIGAAWLVVEHLENRISIYGPGAEYAYGEYTGVRELGWSCEVSSDKKASVNAYGDTAPLAICRAALRAVR